jgi:predicted phosphodiesterase
MQGFKALIIGDYHATQNELEECSRLAEYVLDIVSKDRSIQKVIFLGDQYHSHANIHIKVLYFWMNFFKKLSESVEVIALVGNHDRPGDGSALHSLLPHREDITVVDTETVIGNVGFIAYHPDEPSFLKAYKAVDLCPIVICHQSFQGSVYENGFKAVDGISIDKIKAKVITGHIHKPQSYMNVWYPGAPRWRSLSDANEERFLYLVNTKGGNVVVEKTYPTSVVCKPIKHVVFEEPGAPPVLDTASNWVVDIKGTDKFIKENLVWLEGKCRIRAYPTANTVAKIKESEGFAVSLGKYLDSRSDLAVQTPVLTQEILKRLNLTT